MSCENRKVRSYGRAPIFKDSALVLTVMRCWIARHHGPEALAEFDRWYSTGTTKISRRSWRYIFEQFLDLLSLPAAGSEEAREIS